jgi:hypothetical protein
MVRDPVCGMDINEVNVHESLQAERDGRCTISARPWLQPKARRGPPARPGRSLVPAMQVPDVEAAAE